MTELRLNRQPVLRLNRQTVSTMAVIPLHAL